MASVLIAAATIALVHVARVLASHELFVWAAPATLAVAAFAWAICRCRQPDRCRYAAVVTTIALLLFLPEWFEAEGAVVTSAHAVALLPLVLVALTAAGAWRVREVGRVLGA